MTNHWRPSCAFGIYLCLVVAATTCFMHCDARKLADLFRAATQSKFGNMKPARGMNMLRRFGIVMPVLDSSSNTKPYGVSSPLSLPPYESLPPFPLPENAPPFCVYPPFTPQPPPTTIPTPTGGSTPSPPSPPSPFSSAPVLPNPPPTPAATPSPPQTIPAPIPPTTVPSPPEYVPSPPTNVPSPTEPVLGPPFSEPSPPSYIPNPPIIIPSPPELVPSPPEFLPPIVYPPPAVPPPPHTAPPMALWCVAKPSVPEPIIQEAMNFACASGADCDQIEPNGSCFQPDTVLAHASYAFNSYWQRTKVAGGTCHFGGSAMLVTVDPSYDGCHFLYY